MSSCYGFVPFQMTHPSSRYPQFWLRLSGGTLPREHGRYRQNGLLESTSAPVFHSPSSASSRHPTVPLRPEVSRSCLHSGPFRQPKVTVAGTWKFRYDCQILRIIDAFYRELKQFIGTFGFPVDVLFSSAMLSSTPGLRKMTLNLTRPEERS